MTFKLPSIPYPPARPDEGYWAPVTASLNWCEEDYYATIYSAEIVNTLTNLLFIALGVKGVRNCLRYKHDNVFLVAFIGYLFVGSGSFLFHSTLKYPMQLVDELSMIYTACLMCYATFSFSKSRVFNQALGIGLASFAVFITLYYHYLQDPVFHQNAFAFLTTIILFRSAYVMEVNIRPSFRAKYVTVPQKKIVPGSISETKRLEDEKRDQEIIRIMWMMVAWGLSIFLGGFALWGLDRVFCSTARRWRHEVGLPWGILLEGHGWWHVMTGIGSYFYIVWAIWLRLCLNGKQDEYRLDWPSLFFSLPKVVPIGSTKRKRTLDGKSNGHAKKL